LTQAEKDRAEYKGTLCDQKESSDYWPDKRNTLHSKKKRDNEKGRNVTSLVYVNRAEDCMALYYIAKICHSTQRNDFSSLKVIALH
jgi:hypothetical protein